MKVFTERELWIPRGDLKIYAMCYIPENRALAIDKNGSSAFPTIIIGHGFEGSYKDNLNCAERYAAEGYASISLDFCGGTDHAKSSGRTEDMSIITEKEDMIAVFKTALELDFVDPDRIILWGESMGGYVAALAGAELAASTGNIKPHALVLFYPAFNIRDEALKDHVKKENIKPKIRRSISLGKCFAEDIWDTDPYTVIGGFKGPVLILHGTDDTVVPIGFSERAVRTYDNASYRVIEGAGHGFFNETGAYADSLVTDWLNSI